MAIASMKKPANMASATFLFSMISRRRLCFGVSISIAANVTNRTNIPMPEYTSELMMYCCIDMCLGLNDYLWCIMPLRYPCPPPELHCSWLSKDKIRSPYRLAYASQASNAATYTKYHFIGRSSFKSSFMIVVFQELANSLLPQRAFSV